MADDVHHFRVRLRHDALVVTGVEADAVRTPYSICPGATAPLATLAGRSLRDVARLSPDERAEQCMHLYDLVVLAARHAGAPKGFVRDYRVEVDHDAAPPRARLWRDDEERLAWEVAGGTVRGSRYDGLPFKDLVAGLAEDADEAEAMLILRRASLISFVRRVDFAGPGDGSTCATPVNCFAKQPVRWHEAHRLRDTSVTSPARRAGRSHRMTGRPAHESDTPA